MAETFGLLLVREGLIDRDALYDALRLQKEQGGLLGTCLLEGGHLRRGPLLQALARHLEIPPAPPSRVLHPDPDLSSRFDAALLSRLRALPYARGPDCIYVAFADPRALPALRELESDARGEELRLRVATEPDVAAGLSALGLDLSHLPALSRPEKPHPQDRPVSEAVEQVAAAMTTDPPRVAEHDESTAERFWNRGEVEFAQATGFDQATTAVFRLDEIAKAAKELKEAKAARQEEAARLEEATDTEPARPAPAFPAAPTPVSPPPAGPAPAAGGRPLRRLEVKEEAILPVRAFTEIIDDEEPEEEAPTVAVAAAVPPADLSPAVTTAPAAEPAPPVDSDPAGEARSAEADPVFRDDDEVAFSQATGFDQERTAVFRLNDLAGAEAARGPKEEEEEGLPAPPDAPRIAEAAEKLFEATNEGGVARQLVKFYGTYFPRVIVLTRHGAVLRGLLSRGLELSGPQVAQLRFPLGPFTRLFDEVSGYYGPPPGGQELEPFYQALGETAVHALVVPIPTAVDPPWLLFADHGSSLERYDDVHELEMMAKEAAVALDLLREQGQKREARYNPS